MSQNILAGILRKRKQLVRIISWSYLIGSIISLIPVAHLLFYTVIWVFKRHVDTFIHFLPLPFVARNIALLLLGITAFILFTRLRSEKKSLQEILFLNTLVFVFFTVVVILSPWGVNIFSVVGGILFLLFTSWLLKRVL